MKFQLPILFLAGLVAGMALSDAATTLGLPQGRYLLELNYRDSPERLFTCTKLASAMGENLSTFDPDTKRQENCYIVATGTFNPDGSFQARLGADTWTGRVKHWNHTVLIPAHEVKSNSAW